MAQKSSSRPTISRPIKAIEYEYLVAIPFHYTYKYLFFLIMAHLMLLLINEKNTKNANQIFALSVSLM